MARKESKAPQGAPDWLVTYGDMVTLLLCFFVLMFAYTVVDAKKFEEMRASFKDTEGIPVEDVASVFGPKISDLLTKLDRETEYGGKLMEKGPISVTVNKMRESYVLVLGGNVIFEQGSSEILEHAKPVLDALAKMFHDTDNQIEIRGHTSGEADDALAGNTGFGKWDLSWERSHSIMVYLANKGEPETRFRLSAASRFEPIALNFADEQQERNRRIEMIVQPLQVE